jgi:hypothetical protein
VTSSRAVRIEIAEVSIRTQEDTQLVSTAARLQTVEVTADGVGLASHAGAALVVELADRAGLTVALSAAMATTRKRRWRTIPAGCCATSR